MTNVLSCTICSEIYKATDEVYSTSCGHLFHFHCMQQWQSRSTSCPQCRQYNPQSHKVFLHLEESNENDEEILELKSKVEQYLKTNSELEYELERSEVNLFELQAQYNKIEEENKELKHNVLLLTTQNVSRDENVASRAHLLEHNLCESERDFLSLQKQFCQNEEIIRGQKAGIQNLVIQNENQKKEIELKTLENQKLKEQIDKIGTFGGEIMYREQIKVLEEKLKQISLELEKEIRNSTELVVDKMKLQSILNQYTSATPAVHPVSINGTLKREYSLQSRNLSIDKNVGNKRLTSQSASEMDLGNNNVVIQGITEIESRLPLIHFVLKLAQQMQIECSKYDIEDVFILEKNSNARRPVRPQKLSLVVRFKTSDQKVKFLVNKDKLRNFPETARLVVHEYVTLHVNTLFHYAKTLKTFGYATVYCRNNTVFVRKTKTSPVILIRNRQHVDELKKEKGTPPPEVAEPAKTECDDQLYALE